MNKAYSRINFQNAPSTATPLNATNLNKIDKAINDLDDRIIELSGYQEEAEESAEMASASASAAAKAAETATADAEARVNEVIQGLEVYTKADSHKKFASVIKQVATGSPILIKDSSDAEAIDFKGKGRSTQQIKMKQGYYDSLAGIYATNTNAVCNEKPIPCKTGDNIEITVENTSTIIAIFYNGSSFVSSSKFENTTKATFTIPSNANYYNFDIVKNSSVTPSTVGAITITVNGSVSYPSPNYPQVIKSVADSGYFDGELMQGYYDANGSITSYAGRVSSKNLIPCSEGNEINLIYQESVSSLIISYFKNGTYSSQISLNNVSEISGIVPSDVDSFGISVFNDGITPQTAKKITVTINGKYALIVKSVGKNLIPYPYRDTTHTDGNAVIWTDNGDGTITANGTDNSKQVQQFYLIMDGAMGLEPNTTYILNGCPGVGSLSTYNLRLIINRGLTGSTWIEYRDFGNGVTFTTPSDYKHCSIMIDVLKGTTVSNLLVKPMLRRAEVTDNTYEPYKESVTYIPLNEPLRSSLDGSVSDVASLSEVTRRFAEVVLDGSDDEAIIAFGNDYPHLFRISVNGVKETRVNVICTHFLSHRKANSDYSKNMIYTFNDHILINHMDITTVAEFKAWLQANPIRVIYELAEPITETIEPVDIVTYDNVTYLTASDNADMEVTYATDTKSYIDSKFAELHAALVNML